MATAPEITEQPRQLAVVQQSPAAEKFALMQRQAKTFAMSPLVPQHLRNGSPEQALANCYIALTLAEAMGEVPLIVMQNIHVINGKAGFASKYMIARANASGKFRDDLDWEIEGEGKTLSATCFATLTKTGKRVAMTVDWAMAEAEGWTKNAKYRTMPELMLRYRSASFLVNLYAPEVMLGYRTIEEIVDIGPERGDVVAAPLSATMLIEQAGGAPEPESGFQPEPEPAETITPENPTAAEGRADEDHGDQHDGAEDEDGSHPAQAAADDLILRCQNAKLLGDVVNVEADFEKHKPGLSDQLIADVDDAIAEARNRFQTA